MKNFETMLNDYARLTVEVGINLQNGEPLVVNSPIEGADFVRLVAKNAYELGASEVHVNWNDETLTKLKYANSPMEIFENFPKWKSDSLEYYAEKGAGFLSISAQDPEMLKDMDPKKIAANNKSSSLGLKDFRKYTMNDINSWCVISISTKSWAKNIFPELSEEAAYEKLWEAIFNATRMNEKDPINAWENHIETLMEKNKILN